MTHNNFLVAKNFAYPKHYSTLSKFIEKESCINKARSLNADRCLEFMIEDDNSVEFLFHEGVICVRPGQSDPEITGIELVIRNITKHNQLVVISSLISGSNITNFVKELRALEPNTMRVYTHSICNLTKIYTMTINNGNTLILDGEPL